MELSRGSLGLSWSSLGSLGALLGRSRGCLRLSWSSLEAFLGCLGAVLEPKKPQERFGSILGPFLGPFWGPFWAHFSLFLGSFFGLVLGAILGTFWSPFWSPFWSQIGLKGRQDEPQSAIKSFKEQTSCIFKNLKKPSVFQGF